MAVNLAKYQPRFYEKSEFMKAINSALEAELDRLFEKVASMLLEARIKTATLYLPDWERSVALSSAPALTIEQRRSRVLARLRQMDTTTKERIKVIVESYANGEIDIEELSSEYTIRISFVGLLGIPDNMEGIIEQLDCLMPAHLVAVYDYRWRTWRDVFNTEKTWRELLEAGYTWRDLMEKEIL